ncbi:MAG: hypothetical protein RMK29_05360 [Myxococcales bacterium]|nr:hypothetical protein [Myxococcota bacterium]MDW8281119.1 hypothetical protein [Myxococcales bacterium]
MTPLERLQLQAKARMAALRTSLLRSHCPVEAAPLLDRLEAIASSPQGACPGPAAYLALCRELRTLWQALWRAEAQRSARQRAARAELDELWRLMAALRPELAWPVWELLAELPLDEGMAERLRALRALIEARRAILPHLAAARPHFRR